MQSTVESVEGNKVKLHVTVPADEFERAIDAAFRKLAREVRIPGLPSGQGAAPAARGPPRHRHGARAGAARLAARVLRRRGHRARRRRDRAARDRDHRGPGRRRRRVRRGRRGAPAGAAWSATTSCGSSCRSSRSTTTRSTSRSTALRDRFADLADSDHPLIDDAYATIDITGIDRRRTGRGAHRHRLPLPRRLRHGRARARRAAARHAPGRDPRVRRDAARTLRRSRRRRGDASA